MARERESRAAAGSSAAVLEQPVEIEGQINVPPASNKGLWKVIAAALRCPACGSKAHKAETGKRTKPDGMTEQYRRCTACSIRFRAVYE